MKTNRFSDYFLIRLGLYDVKCTCVCCQYCCQEFATVRIKPQFIGERFVETLDLCDSCYSICPNFGFMGEHSQVCEHCEPCFYWSMTFWMTEEERKDLSKWFRNGESVEEIR